jgi:hypothetical protein
MHTQKLVRVILFLMIIVGCTKKGEQKINNQNKDISKADSIKPELSLLNSVWILGEVGLNGEQPDTLKFIDKYHFKYVSSDLGETIIKYTFRNDTLSYFEKSTEYDSELDKEVTKINHNKFVLKNNKFYNFYYKTNFNNKDTIFNLSDTNVLTRIKS